MIVFRPGGGDPCSDSRGGAACLRPSPAGPSPAKSPGTHSQALGGERGSRNPGKEGASSLSSADEARAQLESENHSSHCGNPAQRGIRDSTPAGAGSGTLALEQMP